MIFRCNNKRASDPKKVIDVQCDKSTAIPFSPILIPNASLPTTGPTVTGSVHNTKQLYIFSMYWGKTSQTSLKIAIIWGDYIMYNVIHRMGLQ